MNRSLSLGALVACFAMMACAGSGESDGAERGSGAAGSGGHAASGGAPGTGGQNGTGGSNTTGSGGASGGGGAGAAGGGLGPPLIQPSSSAFQVDRVATWRGNAKAAYSIIHDDLCDASVGGLFDVANAELHNRGFRAGFGAIVGACAGELPDTEPQWDRVKGLAANGHDVFSHSFGHPCLAPGSPECGGAASSDYATEIDKAHQTLEAQIGAGYHDQFFIFPYDAWNDAAIAQLKQDGYVGSRSGDRGLNEMSFPDSFALKFDVYPAPWSTYLDGAPGCDGVRPSVETTQQTVPAACNTYILQHLVDEAISSQGWGIRELHGIGTSWEPIPMAEYTAHLDWVKGKVDAGDLWVDGPTAVVKYRWAREQCASPTVSDGHTLKFGNLSAACQKHATMLSYLLKTDDDPASLKVQQESKVWEAKKLGTGSFLVDADPSKGDALLGN